MNCCALAVSDTGIGLSKDDMERIFVEFEQVDSSNERRNGGTGLGLAITRRLVETMGGEISVSSVHAKGICVHGRYAAEICR